MYIVKGNKAHELQKKVERKTSEEAVRLSIFSNFELNFLIRNNVNFINPFKLSKIYAL